MKRTAAILVSALMVAGLPFATAEESKKPAKTDKQSAKSGADADKDAEWKRRTEGHRPQDLNGDGVITRNEWPGDDNSFRELDRDGDGALTNKDRGPGAQGSRTRMYDRNVNDYPNRTRK